MATFNQVTFIGRLGKDPEMNYTPNGKANTKFSLAVDQGKDTKGNSLAPMWLNIVCWNELAERMSGWLSKGMPVLVQGQLKQHKYSDKNNIERVALEVIAGTIQILEKRDPNATPTSQEDHHPLGELDDHPF